MRKVRPAVGLLVLVLAVGALGVALWWRPSVAPPAWANDYDLSAKPPETIAPGTEVDRGPPAGWSHLVIKSLPRVKPGEEHHVPTPLGFGRDLVVKQAAWMFTAFAADVVPEQQGPHTRFRLRAIGLGLGAKVNGHDLVLTPESAAGFGYKLNWIERQTLETGYRIQGQARMVVHGPSFAILDTPVTFRCGAKNRIVRYRYALLVDGPTGELAVLLWRLGDAEGCADLTRAVLLHPSTIDPAELIPDTSMVGLPNEFWFGVGDLPPRRAEVTIPPELRDRAAQTKFTPDDAAELEAALRKLLP
jgi:hypothetical protein